MSEVDRVSNSGLYPALPIADRRSSKEDKDRRQRSDEGLDKPMPKSSDSRNTAPPGPPKSRIDDYA